MVHAGAWRASALGCVALAPAVSSRSTAVAKLPLTAMCRAVSPAVSLPRGAARLSRYACGRQSTRAGRTPPQHSGGALLRRDLGREALRRWVALLPLPFFAP